MTDADIIDGILDREKQGEPLAVPTRSGFPADQPAAIASRR